MKTSPSRTPFHRALAAGALALALTAVAVTPASANTSAVDQIVADTNAYRSANGTAALSRHSGIDRVAQAWAQRMLSEHRPNQHALRHNPNYSSQMPQSGLSGWGENVAYACGYGGARANATRIMTSWRNSSGHRANMLNSNFTHIGVGAAYSSSSDCLYAVQNFGRYNYTFWDVPRNHQFYSQINWASQRGITTGYTADGSFRPKENVSREAFAAFLYRLAGRPNVNLPATSPFRDVSPSSQFYREIVWASQRGITNGYTEDNTYRPKQTINRDAMAAFLYRYEGRPSFTPPSSSPFRDMRPSDPFYREVTWLRHRGITTGYTEDNTYRPRIGVSREATAAFIMRLATR